MDGSSFTLRISNLNAINLFTRRVSVDEIQRSPKRPAGRAIAQAPAKCINRPTKCEPVWPSGKALSPFLTGRMFVRRTYFGHFDEL